jgi:hypothetical protein
VVRLGAQGVTGGEEWLGTVVLGVGDDDGEEWLGTVVLEMTSGQGGVVLQMMVGEVGRQSAWTGSRRMGGGRGVAK